MKNCYKLFIGAFIYLLLITASGLFSQDLSAFELIDNNSVGLQPAPFAKRGECLTDIDNNGWIDIYTLKYNANGYSRIHINNNGTFTDITDQTPLQEIEDHSDVRTFNVVWADYDNDGDKDCSFGTNTNLFLLRNDNNHLTDVSQEMGFVGYGNPGFFSEWHYNVCGWADYDLDGDLDCVVYQYHYDNLYLFRNDGDHFTNVATEVGLDGTSLSIDSFINPLVWTDFDLDGDPDLVGRFNFFANEDGHFREVTEEIGLGGLSWVNHKEFFDYDNDGDLDYFKVTGSTTEEGTNEMWENRDGYFYNVSPEVGFGIMRDRFRGTTMGDFDNDGDQDIFLQLNIDSSPDYFLLNEELEGGGRAFVDIAEFVGITVMDDRIGGGFFDYDKDGYLDIYIPSVTYSHILYHNLALNNKNWVGFILEGTISNRDAFGAIVDLYYAGKQQLRYLNSSRDFLRQDNPWIHFGLGTETVVDSVVIRWPLGYKQVLTNIEINQYHNIKEPDYTSVADNAPEAVPTTFELKQNYPNPFNPQTRISYSLNQPSQVKLEVYAVTGQCISVLKDGYQQAGTHYVDFDAHNLPAGLYLYQIKAGNVKQQKKMLLIK